MIGTTFSYDNNMIFPVYDNDGRIGYLVRTSPYKPPVLFYTGSYLGYSNADPRPTVGCVDVDIEIVPVEKGEIPRIRLKLLGGDGTPVPEGYHRIYSGMEVLIEANPDELAQLTGWAVEQGYKSTELEVARDELNSNIIDSLIKQKSGTKIKM